MKFSFFIISLIALGLQTVAIADPTSEQLYYELDRTFPKKAWQADLGFAYDFNNPYLHVLGVQTGVSRSLSPFLNLGLTGDFFSTTQKQAYTVISQQLTRHNETLTVETPQYVVAVQAKLIPIIGYVNLFSKDVLTTEIGPVLRAGLSKYNGRDVGATFGVGMDMNMESKSGFGMHFSVVGDWDQVGGGDFMSRIGVRVGPSLRF